MASSIFEEGLSFKYILLSTKVVQVLYSFEKKHILTEDQSRILQKSKELVSKIMEGSALVEGKEIGLAPSQEGLSAYGYALSTIEKVQPSLENTTEFLNTLLEQIQNLRENNLANVNIRLLINFFLNLAKAFKDDLEKEKYKNKTAGYPVLKSFLNASSFA